MYSKSSRIFSQNGELSQLTPYSDGLDQSQQVLSNGNEDCNEVEYEQDVYFEANRAEYDRGDPEAPLSSRADAICEENRQIRSIVELNLKKMEKKRLKLMEKFNELNTEYTGKLELHEEQAQQSVQLQMAHEEYTEKYQNEMGERPILLKKMKQHEDVVQIFLHKHAEGIKFGEDIKDTLSKLYSELQTSDGQSLIETKQKLIESFKAKFDLQICKAKETKLLILQGRETNIKEIQSLAHQNDEVLYNNNKNQDKIDYLTQQIEELKNSCDNLISENKSYNSEIANLHQQLNEIRKTEALQIQHLKLQINTEEHKNFNLESKAKEAENYSNLLKTKLNNNTNLHNQLTLAIEENKKKMEIQVKEIKEFKEKIEALTKKKEYLTSELKKFENAEDENKNLCNKISALEEKNIINEMTIKEKENNLLLLKNDIIEKTQNKALIESRLSELTDEHERSKQISEELQLKVKETFASYEHERNEKLSQNMSTKQINVKLFSKIDQLSLQLTEVYAYKNCLKKTSDDIKVSTENLIQNLKLDDMKIKRIRKELEEEIQALNENIDLIEEELKKYEELLIETKPKQDEHPGLDKIKCDLEQNILDAQEQFKKEYEGLETNFRTKLLEMDRERDKYSSIVESLLLAEEEATEKLKKEIKATEKTKMVLENKLKDGQYRLNSLKASENSKRKKISNIEMRLRTINKEMKVTRQDISDAITGKNKYLKRSINENIKLPFKPITTSNKEFTDALRNNNQPLKTKMPENSQLLFKPIEETKTYGKEFPDSYSNNQMSTNKWMESAQVDEFEFSDV